eukprot:scaffold273386_cov28-Tisochrysis_lutea.AAC.1
MITSAARDVKHDDRHVRVSYVGWDERSESLLSGGIPQLQPHRPVLHGHRLGDEIDSDGRGVVCLEGSIHEARDDGGLADGLVAYEDEL